MTREEEIMQQADRYTDDSSNYAEWSDDGGWSESNDMELIKKAFINGAKWADKTIIEKACEWISQSYTSGVLDWKNCDSIIENFKKAMEE